MLLNGKKTRSGTTGQVMVLTIFALGGALMGATAIAGLLMVYQIRQTSDLANSTKAVFAADSGVEWGLYQYNGCGGDPTNCAAYGPNGPPLSNGATTTVICYDASDSALPNCINDPVTNPVRSIRAQGSAGQSSRAFLIEF